MTYKQAFADTLCDMNDNLPKGLTDCESYGMTWGCDTDCPTFRSGNCEVCKEDFEVLKSICEESNDEDFKAYICDLYNY